MGGARDLNFSNEQGEQVPAWQGGGVVFTKFLDLHARMADAGRAWYLRLELPDSYALKTVGCGGGADADRTTEFEIAVPPKEVAALDSSSVSTGDDLSTATSVAQGSATPAISDDERPESELSYEHALTGGISRAVPRLAARAPPAEPLPAQAADTPLAVSDLESEALPLAPVPLLVPPPPALCARAAAFTPPSLSATPETEPLSPFLALAASVREENDPAEEEERTLPPAPEENPLRGLELTTLRAEGNSVDEEAASESTPTSEAGGPSKRRMKSQLKYLWLSAVNSVELEQPANPFAFVEGELVREQERAPAANA
jgi:hypothetical protein